MMKKYLFPIAVLCLVGYIYAQDIPKNQVPSVILNQFNSQFPKASDVEWEKKGSVYIVEFEIGWNNDHEVWYNTSGKMVKHEEEIATKNLPKTIKTFIKNNYPNYKIDDAEKFTDGEKIVYKIEIEKRNTEITLFFNENGTLIN